MLLAPHTRFQSQYYAGKEKKQAKGLHRIYRVLFGAVGEIWSQIFFCRKEICFLQKQYPDWTR
jgi:hypothetical protein